MLDYFRSRVKLYLGELKEDMSRFYGEESHLLMCGEVIVEEWEKLTDETVSMHNPALRPTVRMQHDLCL